MEGLLTELQTARTALDKIIGQLQKAGKKGMQELAAPLFAEFPELMGFRWTQYTPYFNDGSECVFEANTDYIDIQRETGDWEDDVSTQETCWSRITEKHGPNPDRSAVAVGNLLSSLGNDGLRALFGDHVQVTVRRNRGVSLSEYDHD